MLHMHCNIPYYMFDCWADPVVHLLLLKSSMVMEEMRLPVSEWERERDCKFVWVSGRERKKTTTTGNKVHQEAQSKSHQNTDVWFDSKSLEKNLFESEKFESLMRATIRCVSERERERERENLLERKWSFYYCFSPSLCCVSTTSKWSGNFLTS